MILRGGQKAWPPCPPEIERGVLLGGYPGTGTLILRQNELSFGAAPAGLVAHSVNELDISCLLERAELMPMLGQGVPPENFDFRGMSGGAMLTIVEKPVSAGRGVQPDLREASSTISTPKPGSPTCYAGSTSIPLPGSTSSCPGTGSASLPNWWYERR